MVMAMAGKTGKSKVAKKPATMSTAVTKPVQLFGERMQGGRQQP